MHDATCARYRALVEESGILFLTASQDGRIDFASTAAGKFFGLPPTALHGVRLVDLVESGERRQLSIDLDGDAAASTVIAERRSRRADGSPRTLLWQHQRMPLEAGGFRWQMVATDVTGRDDQHALLGDLVYKDPLTGLPNRRLFEDRLTQAYARFRRDGTRFAVHLIDLDFFKQINDSFGHATGDAVLREVTRVLDSALRETDTLARLGGDEFAIVQPNVGTETGAEMLARKIQALLDQPLQIAGREIRVGLSIGIVLASDPAVPPERLVEQADRALYAVKDSGRGGWAFDTSALGEAALSELEMARALALAPEEGGLFLLWQPEYNLRRGAIAAVEALLRWRRPDGTVEGPARVVSIAERHGFIQQIGDWVFEHALAQFAAWRASGIDVPRLCINLSVLQLRDEGLAARIRDALQRHGVPAHVLELELTEAGFATDEVIVLKALERLAGIGVGVSIDDFGTGQSSFSCLRRFAFARLKVAQEFAERSGSRDEGAILRAAVSLAEGLGIEAVVEGVESAGALQLLREMGVESIQGYLVSEPEESHGMEQTLRHPENLQARVPASSF